MVMRTKQDSPHQLEASETSIQKGHRQINGLRLSHWKVGMRVNCPNLSLLTEPNACSATNQATNAGRCCSNRMESAVGSLTPGAHQQGKRISTGECQGAGTAARNLASQGLPRSLSAASALPCSSPLFSYLSLLQPLSGLTAKGTLWFLKEKQMSDLQVILIVTTFST